MFNKLSQALVVIDFQNCFMDLEGAPLPVLGAKGDVLRLVMHLFMYGHLYDRIYISSDTHPFDHISFAIRWIDREGNHPPPYTVITFEEYVKGVWRATNPADQEWQGEYLRQLKRSHYIWPNHGEKESWEWKFADPLRWLLSPGNKNNAGVCLFDRCVFIEKGMHRDVEQFGIFGADVPYPDAPETKINIPLITEINSFDQTDWAGEASSHCVMDSVNQFLTHIPRRHWTKVRLIKNCMSPVPQAPGGPNFPHLAEAWFAMLKSQRVMIDHV